MSAVAPRLGSLPFWYGGLQVIAFGNVDSTGERRSFFDQSLENTTLPSGLQRIIFGDGTDLATLPSRIPTRNLIGLCLLIR